MKQAALLAMIVLSVVAAGLAARAPAKRPQSIQEFVEAIDRAEPINPKVLENITGLSLTCSQGVRVDCEAHGVVAGDATIGTLDFRSSSLGTILVLSDFKNECVSLDALMDRFGPGSISISCAHARRPCAYRTTKRPWGRLSVGLPENKADKCATSVAFDTFPE